MTDDLALPKAKDFEEITDISEKKFLLGDQMVRFQPSLGLPTIQWVETLTILLIELPTAWYKVKIPLYEEFADNWIEKSGEWHHGNESSKRHNRLGMAYAWDVTERGVLDKFRLSDSPDFSAVMLPSHENHPVPLRSKVYGDIGRCTPIAMLNGLHRMMFHDVWISVLDWETQVFIHFGYSPNAYRSHSLWSGISANYDCEDAVRKIFYCENCGWSITKKGRANFIRESLAFRRGKRLLEL